MLSHSGCPTLVVYGLPTEEMFEVGDYYGVNELDPWRRRKGCIILVHFSITTLLREYQLLTRTLWGRIYLLTWLAAIRTCKLGLWAPTGTVTVCVPVSQV